MSAHDRWPGFATSVRAGGATDPEALVEAVLREAYEQTVEDLKFYADKVKQFNKLKQALRDYVQDLRDFDSARRAGQNIPHVEIEALKLDVARLTNALRHCRMMEKSHAIGIDDQTRRIHAALSRRPRKH
jgi:hypothetical protein